MNNKAIKERNNYVVPFRVWVLKINYRTIIREFEVSTDLSYKCSDLASKILNEFEVMSRPERQNDSLVIYLNNMKTDNIHAGWTLAKILAKRFNNECILMDNNDNKNT